MPLRYTLRQLEYFVSVGQEGSIVRAAERLNVSSPSISAAIVQLEREFGLQLFVRRHAHGLSLTQGGRQFLAQANEVLHQAERLNGLANEITGTVRGPLNVGCLVTFAQIVLPHLRRRFVDRHPDVEFHQIELHQAEIFQGLRDARLDLALTYDLDLPPDLQFTPLLDLPPYAVMPPDHPLAAQASVTVKELQPHPMILLDLPFSGAYFLALFSESGLRPRIVERTRDIAVARGLVANGFGYSLANIRQSPELAPDGKPLKFIPLSGNARPMRMGVLSPEGADRALTVRAFIEHCQNGIGASDAPVFTI